MANTKIEWTEKTWNPITGCAKISEGCQNCYAERMSKRLGGRCGYDKDNPFKVTFHPDRLDEPLHWKKPSKIFVCSMGDLFHDDVPESWIFSVYTIMEKCPQHTFMILTKRINRAAYVMRKFEGRSWPLPNLWLGVTAENQKRADERIPILLQIPAAKRFVSIEPMLGAVSLNQIERPDKHERETFYYDSALTGFKAHKCGGWYSKEKLNWVICGGETGPKARPMHPDWVRSLRDQCQEAGTPFFFKSWGDWLPAHVLEPHTAIKFDGKIGRYAMKKVGQKHSGRLLDGVEWNEYPEAHA